MNKTEAIKQALDFLMTRRMGAELVIDALQEALAEQPAQQEPAAWVTGLHAGRCVIKTINPAAILPVGIALYTSPPAQRAWVGLTDEGINDLVKEFDGLPITLSYAIEAKLKEKNT